MSSKLPNRNYKPVLIPQVAAMLEDKEPGGSEDEDQRSRLQAAQPALHLDAPEGQTAAYSDIIKS